ncbi:MAG: hypothetical protein WAX38_02960 [Minisyncoccia bacterium]
MKRIPKISGTLTFIVTLLITSGVYGYAVYYVLHAAEKHAIDDKKNANLATSSEFATRILGVARDTRAIREKVASFFYTEEKLVRVFDIFDVIGRATKTKIVIDTIQTLPNGDVVPRPIINSAGELKRISADTQATRGKVTSAIALDLMIVGEEDAVFKALETIEALPYVSKINEIRVGKNQQADGIVARVTFSLTVQKVMKK